MQRVFAPSGHIAYYGGILEKQSVNIVDYRYLPQPIFHFSPNISKARETSDMPIFFHTFAAYLAKQRPDDHNTCLPRNTPKQHSP